MSSRRLVLALFALLSLAVGARRAGAEAEPVRLPLEVKDVPAARVDWYGVYVKGAKSGWMRESFSKEGTGDAAVYVSEQSGRIEMKSMGKQIVMEMTERREFDALPPFRLRFGKSRMVEGGHAQEVELRRGDTGYKATATEGGESRAVPVPEIELTLADALTPERWFQSPRAAGDTLSVRTFDLDDVRNGVDDYTVTARKESVVAGVTTVWYEVKQYSRREKMEGTARVDTRGIPLSMQFAGMFEMRLEPESTAKKIEKGADLFVEGLAKVDKPLGSATGVRRLVLEVGGEAARTLRSGPRQAVAPGADGKTVVLSLGAAYGESPPATEAEIREALEESVEYPTKMPQVVELAAKAVGDAKTPREKVGRLVRFVSSYVEDAARPEAVSVAQIIASRRGDCTEHATLLVALARAVGVPARQVTGLMYMGDDVRAFGGHAWDEVVLDGVWVPVDPTWTQTEIDAAHVTLQRGEEGAASLETSGKLTFKVRELERAK